MKLGNKILSFVMLAILMAVMVVPVFATTGNEITPYFNNTSTVETIFTINESGYAILTCTCRGYRGIVSKIVIDTKIEKQSGSSWVEVDGASWTDESTLYYCSKEHSIQLSARGTYKATVTYTVSGSGGATDVITREIERTY